MALAGLAGVGVAGGLVQRQPTVQALEAAAVRRLRPANGAQHLAAPPAQVTLRLKTLTSARPISPLIYGVAVANQEQLSKSGARLNRWGGNPNTRYNWAHGSAWNSARDWEFRNYGSAATSPSSTADSFVATNRSASVESVLTVPAIGWVARNGDNASRSINVPASGGPPLADNPDAIAGYDPTANRSATSVRSVASVGSRAAGADSVRQDDWVRHLVERFGSASAGGVGWYVIDNEPDLWPITHTDVHPVQPSYDDMLELFLEYANAIKDVDPSARVLGPALSGWTSYFYSARDRGTDNYKTHADRKGHGDVPFLPWWLDQVRRRDEQAGRRSLDALDVHFYPQANGVFGGGTDPATNELRLRSTRALWDPEYVDESWINDTVMLIPRLRAWIDQYYPGTLLAINEWNWGADTTMNGALAIANVLGIFGREGVDMAAYWVAPPNGSPGASVFSLFASEFGDRSLAATSDHPDDVAIYASRDTGTDDLPTILVNNRPDASLHVTLSLDDTSAQGSAIAYRVSASMPSDIEAIEGYVDVQHGAARLVLPAASVTLLRLNVNSTDQ